MQDIVIDYDQDRSHSALHSGIFQGDSAVSNFNHPPSPINPNFSCLQNSRFPSFNENISIDPSNHYQSPQSSFIGRNRSRGQSIGSLSNYILKQPTSPLARSTSSNYYDRLDEEFGSDPISISGYNTSHARRPSLVQQSLSSFTPLSPSSLAYSRSGQQSRKLIADNWHDTTPVTPGTSKQQSRRLSAGFGINDFPFGSFVGSYEESILNGRMSTTPSKPLTFLAKIGVLGLGDCKPSLKCPTHLTIPFPAYFYSVGDYDSPSPYVGQVDLETALAENAKASKTFPDGGYRIPQCGQIQIVIKNPNKTAVKLFLIPYDLTDMQPRTKTFIRQKSYSADAMTEYVPKTPSSPTNGIQRLQRDKEREALRYLIHLHICSPSRGKFYLYRNIRVVFANRVPDSKEKLRIDVQQPCPKYSPWKSCRTTTPSNETQPSDIPSAMKTIGLGRRRRTSSLLFSLAAQGIELPEPHPSSKVPEDDKEELGKKIDSVMTYSKTRRLALSIKSSSENMSDEYYDKLSSSIYSNSSGKSENSQSLLALKLKKLDVHGKEL